MTSLKGSDGNFDREPAPAFRTDKSTPADGIADAFCRDSIREDCAELLHSLNNTLGSTLLNTQVMEWKLPSYSRLRRHLHEIERNAQRGGELVKRLLQRLDAAKPDHLNVRTVAIDVPALSGVVPAIADEGLETGIPI